ncbi:MAG: RNA polymerase factor sigma-54, partial [Gammaproteobacteria bacterium]
QAIRLLQLSTLDLKQEIQDALESNLMLETEEDGQLREQQAKGVNGDDTGGDEIKGQLNEADNEREINVESTSMPDELPVDTAWDDLYETPSYSTPSGSGDDSSDFLTQQSRDQTLQDYLQWQLNLSHFSDVDAAIAAMIVDGIDEDGYLGTTLEDIVEALEDPDIGLEEVEAVLHRVQNFDPPGVAARDLRESLLLQLRQLPPDEPHVANALRLVGDYFELLANQDEAQIKRRCKLEGEELAGTVRLIRSLNPRPGTSVVTEAPAYVEPDVFVYKRNDRWVVELNPDAAPRLRVNGDYASLIRRADNSADNATLKNHLQEARWFIKSLQSRNDTLLRVATKIVEVQRNFFEFGEEAMKPLVLRDIAEALEMHESTISRVTSQKYMYTPRGTLEFKYFFSSHVSTSSGGEASATAIRALIKKLIAAEKPAKPLSDNKIAAILEEQGIQVARRTVAKYRESMAIPPSNERKRLA